MSDPSSASEDSRRSSLVGVFFLSGATSLVYQSVWARELHLVLGTSSYAISVVLAAFMGGLGVGGALGARYAPRVARPLRAYGLLELGIGAWALAFPHLISAVTPLYVATARLPGADLWHGLLAGALLLPPTVAMGATLPLLTRLFADQRGTVGDRVAVLYAANTFGAVAGTLVAGLVSLPILGAAATTRLAALGNLGLGAAAAFLDPRFPPAALGDDLADAAHDEAAAPGMLAADPTAIVVAGLGGLAALACEVTWTRLTGLVLGGTTYAFTAMLISVLLGVAVGGRMGGMLADDALRSGGTPAVLRSLGGLQVALAALVAGMTLVWPQLPYLYVWLFDAFDGTRNPSAVFVASFVCAVLVMLPPAVAMGATFPFAVRAAVGDAPEASGPVGRVYAANTLGGVVGAASAGFLVIPALGLQGAIGIAAAVNALAGALALHRGRSRAGAAAALLAAVGLGVARAPWDPLWMSGGLYNYVSSTRDHDRAALRRFTSENQELLFYDEGRSSVVTVGRNLKTGSVWLANNGKVDASSSGDMPTQVLVGLVGVMYAERLDETLVIGLASGITAGALLPVPGLASLEVAELEPAVVDASRLFADFNHHLLDDPRVEVVVNDGRNHLLRAAPGTYDLVVSEPSNPYRSGVANLFTQEFWALGRSRLKPGGVWAQWIQLYGMGPDEVRGLLRTFAETYPHVALYTAIEGADLVLVGSERPLAPRPELARALLADPAVAAELAPVGVRFPLDLVALHAMDRAEVLSFAGDAPYVTDDNLRVEYAAPLWLHTEIASRNWADLLAAAQIPWAVVGEDPLDRLDLAEAYDRIGDPERARRVRERVLAELPAGSALAEQVSEALAAPAP